MTDMMICLSYLKYQNRRMVSKYTLLIEYHENDMEYNKEILLNSRTDTTNYYDMY